jgi:REP element-mobilizing transposase RayT
LQEYDYRWAGAYFVTISTASAKPIFGEVVGEEVSLNQFGTIASSLWEKIPAHFPAVQLDQFIVMPNHIHGIVWIRDKHTDQVDVGAQHAAPLRQDKLQVRAGSLGAIVRSYKSAVTRQLRLIAGKDDLVVWQRNYYERIIRDDQELNATRHYIQNNARK